MSERRKTMLKMKKKIGNSFDEQETIINSFPKQVSEKASVYTAILATLNYMWKLYEKYPDEVSIIHDDQYGTEFSVPKDWIKIKPKRQISDEQKEILKVRLAARRE